MIKNHILDTKKYSMKNHTDIFSKKSVLGFWIYLMSDCILFATMFSVYCVMSQNIILDKSFFNLKIVFVETVILLLSSVFYGISILSIEYQKFFLIYFFLLLSFFFGVFFIVLEIYEFHHLIQLGYSPQNSGLLSSFFTLVGLHGAHVTIGLLWMLGIFLQTFKLKFNNVIYNRMLCLGLFWHFLDIIWICVFTIVYLIGKI
ncbi:cytochrome c oxidase subunit 3 [Buchnera aphidicola]|uniref:cytochrome c oxidase subunit 3 n=1 Tax=Buchnera aphidicola TaxID=9 RepID=UPI003464E039